MLLLVTSALLGRLHHQHGLALINSFGLVRFFLKTLCKSRSTGLEAIVGTSLIYLLRQSTAMLLPSIA